MEDNGNRSGLSNLLIELRTKKNMTQKELAEKLHVSDKTVSRWETGGNLPDMDMLYTISKFFKISVNDLALLRVKAQDGNEEIVQEMIKDFTRKDKQKQRIIKYILIITLSIIVFLIGIYIFSQSYNRFKVYKVTIKSNDIYPCDGIYVETKIKDSLYLNNITLKNYIPKNDDIISVDLYYTENDKEYILYSYSSLENIQFVNYDSYIKIDNLSKYFDNLYIKVTIIDSKNREKKYTGKLQFVLDFSNNKIYNNDIILVSNSSIDLTPEEIKTILLKNGFEDKIIVFYKTYNDKTINYYIQSNKIEYNYEKENDTYRYYYEISKNILEVSIFNEDNIEIENYKYDVTNDKLLSCNIGKCNGYKEAMEILNKNVLYLLKK